MYAIVRTGGKQYRVTAGSILEVEKLEGDIGDIVVLDEVLLVSNGDSTTIGRPLVENATVAAAITGQHKGRKIQVFRYRPKKRIRVRRGHRQLLTRLEIKAISMDGEVYMAEAFVAPEVEEEPMAAAFVEEEAEVEVESAELEVDEVADAEEGAEEEE